MRGCTPFDLHCDGAVGHRSGATLSIVSGMILPHSHEPAKPIWQLVGGLSHTHQPEATSLGVDRQRELRSSPPVPLAV